MIAKAARGITIAEASIVIQAHEFVIVVPILST